MSNLNLSFGTAPTLPPPDQQLGNSSAPGEAVGAAGTPTAGGDKNVGGSTAGVHASKGAATAVGVNSLIVDQAVKNTVLGGGISGTGLDAANILGETPSSIDPETMITSLGNVANDLDQIGSLMASFSLGLSGTAGSGRSPIGTTKGDEGAVESTGTESSATADTPTTMSAEETSQTQGSSSSESTPLPYGEFSFTTIMDEIGVLTNQEGETMSQQQTDQIAAISLQAHDTMQQASQTKQGASGMMLMAGLGLGVSSATAGFQSYNTGVASAKGDTEEMHAMDETNRSLNHQSDTSLAYTKTAIEQKTPASIADARKANADLRASARNQRNKGAISEPQKKSYEQQADLQDAALDHAEYLKEGRKDVTKSDRVKSEYENKYNIIQPDPKITATGDAAAEPKATIQQKSAVEDIDSEDARTAPQHTLGAEKKTAATGGIPSGDTTTSQTNVDTPPKDAAVQTNVNDHIKKAASLHTERTKGASDISFAKYAEQGIKPREMTQAQAEKIIRGDESNKNLDPNEVTKKAQDLKTQFNNLKINRHTDAWHRAYGMHSTNAGVYAGVGNSLSVFLSQGLANMKEQTNQAQSTQFSAAAQVQGATIQAMDQGVSQTQSVASQLREEMGTIAQDMQSTVSATRV